MKKSLLPLLALLLNACQTPANPMAPGPHEVGARQIPLTDQAYAGSSVNVVAGSRQTLFTDSVHQYAGFYDASGRLVLAKRRLGEDHWQARPTEFTADLEDAHNSISLVVDGKGYLHVAWGHHNTPLSYSRGVEPGSLIMSEPRAMTGEAEQSLTYPQFFRLENGNLLFLYRDGGSGNGRLVLNHYDAEQQKWSRRQSNLIDGESQRSAYWDMSIDHNGRLHLAWTWRETPDVASNHDLLYARSDDQGQSWQRSDGSDYSLPITQGSAEVAAAIPQHRNLMNPPAVGANRQGQPVIASYWSPRKDARPRFNLVHRDERGWHAIPGPEAGRDFTLQGQGTKRPPISRAALLVDTGWDKGAHLIYRDDSRGGRVLAASLDDLPGADPQNPQWHVRYLTEKSVGAWEPSIDPMQWQRMKQAQLLLQPVTQLDGDDHSGSDAAPSPLNLLIWSPVWEHHQRRAAAGDTAETRTKSVATKTLPTPQQVLDYARRVAEWQWANMPDPNNWHFTPKSWGVCPLYIGSLDIAPLIPDAGLEQRVLQQSRESGFEPQEDTHDADIYCVSQAYLRLYKKYGREEMLAPTQTLFDRILAEPSPHNLDWGYAHSRERWSWSDALFMGPMSWLLMWEVTGEQRYLDLMNREWWATTERLYREELGLYFRDESYLDVREKNDKTVHWARGTSWSIAGLVQVIQHLPEDHPDYPRYTALFRQMAAAFARAQQNDGLWRPGLLDPQTHNARETSGSAFISFALASGINQGLIDRETYLPRVQKAWTALTASVADDGKLRNVQPVGAGPHGFDPDNAEPFAAGAFLLLAKELYQMSTARH